MPENTPAEPVSATRDQETKFTRSSRLLFGISAPAIILVPIAGVALSMVADPPAVDRWWRSVIVPSRTEPLTSVAEFFDVWGADGLGFGVFPGLIALALLLTRKARAIPGIVVAGSVSLLLVQTLKPILDRARPDDMLTISDVGSFPSGHVTNAATLCTFAALIYRRLAVTVMAIGYVLTMAWSRTYLSAHWLSDTIAGALWGAAVAAVVFIAGSAIAGQRLRRRAIAESR